MKPSAKIKQIPEIISCIETFEEKIFSFYKRMDVNYGMVKDRVDEYNGIEFKLPEAGCTCSAMNHCIFNDLIYFRQYKRPKEYFVHLKKLNVYEKVKYFDVLDCYLYELDEELKLIIEYSQLPERTQEEIDRYNQRVEEQIKCLAEKMREENEMV